MPLSDFGLALAFGIVFQYFSIAPMAGDYGWKTIVRSLKADLLSLTFFEIGLFGWMAIFDLLIFDQKLGMNTVAYWFMMQVGNNLVLILSDETRVDITCLRSECSLDIGLGSR